MSEIFNGIESILKENQTDMCSMLDTFDKVIHTIKILHLDGLYGYKTFDEIFLRSNYNNGTASSIKDFFKNNGILTLKDLKENPVQNHIFFTVEFYCNIILNSHKYILKDHPIYPYILTLIQNSTRICSFYGYEIVFEDEIVKIVRSEKNILSSEPAKKINSMYYDYSNSESLEKKREILREISVKLEPLRATIEATQKELKRLNEFFFRTVNNYSVRHNNREKSDSLDSNYSEEDYIRLYDAAFNAGISILDYFR